MENTQTPQSGPAPKPATTSAEARTKHLFTTYQAVYFIFGTLEVILAFRFVFRLLGANPESGFVNALYSVTGALLAPFFGIFGTPTLGTAAFETTTLVGMAVYAALGFGIVRLIRLMTTSHEESVTQNTGENEANL